MQTLPLSAKELFKAGKVRETIEALTAYLREHPSDVGQRTFLFELLCFAGEFTRAEKQLAVLGSGTPDKETGAVVYYAALHAEKTRHELFAKRDFPSDSPPCPSGELNGTPFTDLRDANPAIGARMEVFAAGSYVWLPLQHLASIQMEPPQRLRDTFWAPALVQAAPSFRGMDLGEVLIPAVYPFSWEQPDEQVWLGRVTEWFVDQEGREFPAGQKMLLVDGEEFPFLEVRSLIFHNAKDVAND
jgi:type VI secretion system protein ImpE